MENNNQANTPASQGNGDTTPRDGREERRNWPLHGLFPGLILILLGTLFLLDQTGAIYGDTWWQAFLIGLGGIFIVSAIAKAYYNHFRQGGYGNIIAGIVLIMIGTFFMIGISEWWPIILIVIGGLILTRFFWRRINALP